MIVLMDIGNQEHYGLETMNVTTLQEQMMVLVLFVTISVTTVNKQDHVQFVKQMEPKD